MKVNFNTVSVDGSTTVKDTIDSTGLDTVRAAIKRVRCGHRVTALMELFHAIRLQRAIDRKRQFENRSIERPVNKETGEQFSYCEILQFYGARIKRLKNNPHLRRIKPQTALELNLISPRQFEEYLSLDVDTIRVTDEMRQNLVRLGLGSL